MSVEGVVREFQGFGMGCKYSFRTNIVRKTECVYIAEFIIAQYFILSTFFSIFRTGSSHQLDTTLQNARVNAVSHSLLK